MCTQKNIVIFDIFLFETLSIHKNGQIKHSSLAVSNRAIYSNSVIDKGGQIKGNFKNILLMNCTITLKR